MIAANPDIAGLVAALEINPANWSARLLLADAYSDAGLGVLEAGQRWQVRRRKRPDSRLAQGRPIPGTPFFWHSIQEYLPRYCMSVLPNRTFARLRAGWAIVIRGVPHDRIYDTLAEAEADLAQAISGEKGEP
jgi:hypothetical protein